MVFVMLQIGLLNIFIFKIIEFICSYLDKQKGKELLKINVSYLDIGFELFIVVGVGFFQVWIYMQILVMKRGVLVLSECVYMCEIDCI